MARKKALTDEERARIRDDLHRDTAQRAAGYRARALALFPHVCGSCAREFSGRRLKELTVHHKDHNHENNPPDGSNWELLCIYCHDHEHEKVRDARYISGAAASSRADKPGLANPFAALEGLSLPEAPEDATDGEG